MNACNDWHWLGLGWAEAGNWECSMYVSHGLGWAEAGYWECSVYMSHMAWAGLGWSWELGMQCVCVSHGLAWPGLKLGTGNAVCLTWLSGTQNTWATIAASKSQLFEKEFRPRSLIQEPSWDFSIVCGHPNHSTNCLLPEPLFTLPILFQPSCLFMLPVSEQLELLFLCPFLSVLVRAHFPQVIEMIF